MGGMRLNIQEELKRTAHELMELHIGALFTHDRNMRLRTVNEPWPGDKDPAPRFILGRTIEGTAVCRFRHDVPDTIAEQLEELCADEPNMTDIHMKPKHFESYMALLQGREYTAGPCYLVPAATSPSTDTVVITRDNIAELLHDDFEWLVPEIDFVQPCIAIVRDNKAVSICRSVRVTPRAHEAGLETLTSYRGRGYAAEVAAGWAAAVRQLGCLPLYSTSLENLSSQSVARKLGLSLYGVNFTVK